MIIKMHSFFLRFVNDLQFHPLPIPGSHLVVQAVEQCFGGSLLQFGFRICSSTKTASQIAYNSAFHLNNIVKQKIVVQRTKRFTLLGD